MLEFSNCIILPRSLYTMENFLTLPVKEKLLYISLILFSDNGKIENIKEIYRILKLTCKSEEKFLQKLKKKGLIEKKGEEFFITNYKQFSTNITSEKKIVTLEDKRKEIKKYEATEGFFEYWRDVFIREYDFLQIYGKTEWIHSIIYKVYLTIEEKKEREGSLTVISKFWVYAVARAITEASLRNNYPPPDPFMIEKEHQTYSSLEAEKEIERVKKFFKGRDKNG